MNDEITNIPKIRFKGYTEDWEQRKLGDESDVRDGTHDSPKYYDKGYPLVTSKNLKDFGLDLSNVSFISDEDFEVINKRSKVGIGDILFGMIGTIGNPVLVDRADFAIKNVALIKEQKKILNSFLIQILKSPVFDKYIKNENAGGTQKFLSLSKIRDFNFLCPNIEEQNCISAFFKQLDDTIALHQRELDLLRKTKQTYLQKMFPKTGEDRPEIRFAGFTEPWEQRKLGEVARRVTRKNKELDSIRPLTISAQEGLIDQNEFFNKTVASGDLSGYYLVKNGEFAYNKSYSNGYPWGAIKRLNRYDMGVLSTLYIVFKPIGINSEFLEKYYDTNYWHKEVSKYAAEGARNHGLLNIAASDFFETEIIIPSNIEEQQKIGSFFKTFDDTIALHQRNLNGLKEMKKSLLQQMFV